MRLIDADEARKLLTELRITIHDTGNVYGISGTIDESVRACVATGVRAAQKNLDRMQTIEAEPVKHGQLEMNNPYGVKVCSLCGYGRTMGAENYCPNCGARMDGGAENDEC